LCGVGAAVRHRQRSSSPASSSCIRAGLYFLFLLRAFV
jgi:hypothetical protein